MSSLRNIVIIAILAFLSVISYANPDFIAGVMERAGSLSDYYELAKLAQELGENGFHYEAISIFGRALQFAEGPVVEGQIEYNLAFSYMQLGEINEALRLFVSAGEKSKLPDAFMKAAQLYNDLGEPLKTLEYLNYAAKYFRNANPEVFLHLGDTLNNLRRFREAEQQYEKGYRLLDRMTSLKDNDRARELAVKLKRNAGDALVNLKDTSAAAAHYAAALALDPHDTNTLASLFTVNSDTLTWEHRYERERTLLRKSARRIHKNTLTSSALEESPLSPYSAIFVDMPHDLRVNLSRSWSQQHVIHSRRSQASTYQELASRTYDLRVRLAENSSSFAELFQDSSSGVLETTKGAIRKLRLGYIARRFEDYAGTYLMLGLLGAHDKRRVSIHCFGSGVDDGSAARKAVQNRCDTFTDLLPLSTAEAAEAIAAAQLDALVDYDGLHEANNLGVLALRPAPAQATFLGFAGTTGQASMDRVDLEVYGRVFSHTDLPLRGRYSRAAVPALDFMFSDRVTTPAEVVEAALAEKSIFLPGSYQPQDPFQGFSCAPSVCEAFGLAPGSKFRRPNLPSSPVSMRKEVSEEEEGKENDFWRLRTLLREEEGIKDLRLPQLPQEYHPARVPVGGSDADAFYLNNNRNRRVILNSSHFKSALLNSSSPSLSLRLLGLKSTPQLSAAVNWLEVTRIKNQHFFHPSDSLQVRQRGYMADSSDSETAVLVSFNRWHKMDPETLTMWANSMHRAPNSLLWVYVGGEKPSAQQKAPQTPQKELEPVDDTHERNLMKELRARGIHDSRVVLARKAPRRQHLLRHYAADLYLDTRVYGAHTTAADALYAAMPVVTLRGRSFASRVGASLVAAAAQPLFPSFLNGGTVSSWKNWSSCTEENAESRIAVGKAFLAGPTGAAGTTKNLCASSSQWDREADLSKRALAHATVAFSAREFEDIASQLARNKFVRHALKRVIDATVVHGIAEGGAGMEGEDAIPKGELFVPYEKMENPLQVQEGIPLYHAKAFAAAMERAALYMAELRALNLTYHIIL